MLQQHVGSGKARVPRWDGDDDDPAYGSGRPLSDRMMTSRCYFQRGKRQCDRWAFIGVVSKIIQNVCVKQRAVSEAQRLKVSYRMWCVSPSSDFPRAVRVPLRVPRRIPLVDHEQQQPSGVLFASTLSGGKLQNHKSPMNLKMRVVL